MNTVDEITRDNASDRLISFIMERGVKQSEIAKKSGLTENTISMIVNGARPQAVTLQKLKNYLSSVGWYVEKK